MRSARQGPPEDQEGALVSADGIGRCNTLTELRLEDGSSSLRRHRTVLDNLPCLRVKRPCPTCARSGGRSGDRHGY
jgi:hypothetical protein